MCFVVLLVITDRAVFGRVALLISAGCLYYLGNFPSFPGAPVVGNLFVSDIDYKVDYKTRMASVYESFKIPDQLIKLIGNDTIDFYPYNNEYAFANKLNYLYPPLFQNYMTLTPVLDKMNEDFFSSPGRPKFILWAGEYTFGEYGFGSSIKNPFDAFDMKYGLNEDPLTVAAILQNYHKVAISESVSKLPFMLMEENKKYSEYSSLFLKDQSFVFDKWYDVPNFKEGLLEIKPNLRLTMYGKIKNLLFRGDILKIKYQLSSGEIKEYKLNILNAHSGIVVSPLLNSFDLSGPRVVRIMFVIDGSWYFHPSFNVKWIVLPDAGVLDSLPSH